jgi:protein-S-isoprenylcysteine O-methyltransferase Ste14
VTRGVYRRVRHPMYSAIFLYGFAQALLLANGVAGPACLVAFTIMFLARVAREERMMRDRFGGAYEEYAARSKRLVPGVW